MVGPLASPPSDLWAIHLNQHTEDVEVVLKAKLPQSLWNLSPDDAQESSNEFLEYYRGQLVGVEAHKLNLKTHRDLIGLIDFIKTRADFTKPELIDCLETSWSDLGPPIPAIELALRVWLFLPMEEWGSRQTLEQYIHSKFPRSNSLPDSPPIALNFNALNLEQIGGFNIVWTESLQDHLSLSIDDTEKELRIFHIASFLHGYGKSRDRPIFPPGFLEETARTLSLLIPSSNLKCQRWIRKARRQDEIDLEAAYLPPTSRDLADFPYWGRQLMELRDEYERTEPTTVRQWILDKRKPNQRYTFWIAVIALFLALVFGLIQSVTGIIQAMHIN
ncbi:uncharacterized protein N7473_007331 [Penicillium subrubescens]|uniref:Uncharacterized protein n=1 Tax=Penicillium subrubescens TaxID=1316194 RepID=A0A1Q5T9W6_9EURO|nr:uncharacterized protein N7473_007331 [Penicillium subrubescens]KAJ5891103.1 hypothetical protein N7473_007331 [Penicillium subrubescens]OKO96968.1 hypothetical protein PENSUB_10371 [Penicillium subrubescens]